MGILGAISIDLIDNNPLFQFLMTKPFFREIRWLHGKLHWHFKKVKWYWCAIFEILVLTSAIWYLVKFLL